MPFIPDDQTKSFTPDATGFTPDVPVDQQVSQNYVPKGIATNLALGAGKGIISTILGVGKLGTKAASLIPSKLVKDEAAKSNAMYDSIMPRLKADTTSQAIGKGAEQIAELFVPIGVEANAEKLASKLPEIAKEAPLAAKLTQGLIKTGIRSAGSAAEFGAKTYVQSGGDVGETKKAALVAGAIPIASSLLKVGGEALAKLPLSLNSKEAKLMQAYQANTPFWDRVLSGNKGAPVTTPQTAFDKGIMGTESMIGVQAKRGASNLWDNMIKPALDGAKNKVNMSDFWNQAKEQIIKENPELSRQGSLLKALDSLMEDYKGVKSVTLKKLQTLKEGWAKFVPEKAYKGEPIAGAFNDMKDVVSGIARKTIYDTLGPEIKQAYFDYGNLINLQELGQKAMTGGKLKGGFGGFWSAIKDIGLTPIGTVGGHYIYKAGNGLELVGGPAARTVSDIIPSTNK